MDLTIRNARYDDVEALVGLIAELFAIETDFPIDADRQRRGLEQLMVRDEACVLVALSGTEVVGMCTLQTLISTAEGGAVGLVEDLVVAGRHKRQGIGRALLDAIEDRARERGLTRLQLLADRGNEAALVFYGKNGWAETSMIALRRLMRRG